MGYRDSNQDILGFVHLLPERARQRILDIVEDQWDEGTSCAGIVLQPRLVPVVARPTKPFQGWRYLAADAAPADLTKANRIEGEAALPPALRRDLRALGLL